MTHDDQPPHHRLSLSIGSLNWVSLNWVSLNWVSQLGHSTWVFPGLNKILADEGLSAIKELPVRPSGTDAVGAYVAMWADN